MALTYAFAAFGLILTVFGVWRLYGCIQFYRRSTEADGRLVDWETARPGAIGSPSSSGGRRSYRAIVAFSAADGSEHRVKSANRRLSFSKPSLPMGSSFPVRYDAHNPKDGRIATLTDFWLLPIASVALGGVLLAIAVSHT